MAVEQPTRKIPSKPIDPVGSLLKHLPMVLIIVVVIMGVGLAGVMLKVKPFYTAGAVVTIEPVIPKILYGKEEASITPYYDDFVRTQINIIKSFPVLEQALERYHKQGFTWSLPGESTDQAVSRLAVRLAIGQLRDTQLFSLSMTSRRKEGLAELINAVAEAYLEAMLDEQLNKDASRLTFLKSRKEEIETELGQQYDILQNISAKYAVGITDEKNIYVYLQAIVDLTQQMVKATSRRIEVESKLKELTLQVEKLKTVDLSADVDEWVENDWAIRDNRIQLSRKLQDMRLVLAGVNEKHPDRLEYEESLEKLYEVQANLLKRAEEVGRRVIRGKLLSDQSKKIMELETEYAAAVKTEEKLNLALAEAEKKATDVNTQMMKASTLRKDIQRLQDSLLRIDERIDQIEVESRAPGRARLITAARKPEKPSAGGRSKMMVVVVLMSLMSGVGYAIGRDKLDDRVHTTQDVRRVLGFAATGHVLDARDDRKAAKERHRIVEDSPFSHTAENFKAIAYTLTREHERHQSAIYAVMAPAEGHGASTFAVNTLCAVQEQPQKKILVDLNPWNPVSRTLTSKTALGLWDVMEGRCPLKEAIVTDSGYPFHLLPLGTWRQERRSLFQEFGMETAINLLRTDYEYVLIDAPPLGLSTDAKFVARLADVAVLVATAGAVKENELLRMVQTLADNDVKVVSVVLNRLRLLRGKYYKRLITDYNNLTKA